MSRESETFFGWVLLVVGALVLSYEAIKPGDSAVVAVGGVLVLLGAYGLGKAARPK